MMHQENTMQMCSTSEFLHDAEVSQDSVRGRGSVESRGLVFARFKQPHKPAGGGDAAGFNV